MTTEHVELTLRHARLAGIHVTPVPALQIIRSDQVQPRIHSLHRASLCYIVQGAKEVTVGGEVFRYAGSEFLFSSVELPMTGEVTEATAKKPYLCLVLEIEPSLVFDLVSALNILDRSVSHVAKQAIFVGTSDEHMADAFLRLLRCLQSQVDAQVLAPGVIREIAYRLLRGPYGAVVRQLGIADSQTRRIAHVIERLKRDYAKPLRAKELARIAGMSVSSFHQHFKKLTTLSPLQYQKQLRLQEARRLVLGNRASAAEVGFRVGYESPSQFSREYARCFGLPPIADARRAQPR